ncbi:MAG: sodium ion-translocating decarboxylase subunit beta [Propionibacteriaceae bacterium]|jgi:oxaloacetate decarboxylase beta subunit|nr:sodium ion-translocating decarboxylase subunit beta [Propionibacteriaceae bacterium]
MIWDSFGSLFAGVGQWLASADGVRGLIMIVIGCLLLFLAVAKDFEPLLLLPIGVGCIWANLPLSAFLGEWDSSDGHLVLRAAHGLLSALYDVGVANEVFPLLIFIGIGAMTDFGPLLENPKMIFLGGAGQFGIFLTLLLALALGFAPEQAASIGVIGAIDGPTSIYVSARLSPDLLGPITVAAYSYMALVPIIMPPVMRLLTTPAQRAIKMAYSSRTISRTVRIVFPVAVTIVVGLLVPFALPLVGSLMLGNLMRESGVVERLARAAQNELANVVTLCLGLAIGSTMVGANFLNLKTLAILGLGLFAFVADTAVGVLMGHFYRIVTRGKFNPLIGAAGISAFPMAARVVQREAAKADYGNFILMHAMGANAAGQIASAMAGGVLLALLA